MKKLAGILLLMIVSIYASAQQPQQDCVNGIPVTYGSYYQPTSYSGIGLDSNEVNTSTSCLNTGEVNSVWYKLTTATPGNMGFVVIPNNMSDDYDWAVYDITTLTCSDIYNTPAMEVSCNYSSNPGATGPNGGSHSNQEPMIQVQPGDQYAILLTNFSSTWAGYTIIFSTNSSAITSVNEADPAEKALVAPNPVSDHAWISIPGGMDEPGLYIYNSNGQLVREHNKIKEPKMLFERGSLENGVYLYELRSANGMQTRGKLVLVPQ